MGRKGVRRMAASPAVRGVSAEEELERLIRSQRRDFAGSHWNGYRWIYEWTRDACETRLSMAARRNLHGF
jgi:hypothetical protein